MADVGPEDFACLEAGAAGGERGPPATVVRPGKSAQARPPSTGETVMAAGGCHCGAVRYEVEGPPVRHGICHCADCRRHAGAPLVSWAIWPAARVRVTAGEPAVYASSAHGRRHFCPACGTGLFYTNAEIFEGMTDVQSATLDDPGQFAPTEQIQLADRIPWMAGAHELPGHERYPES